VGANLGRANLSAANLSRAYLGRAKLKNAKLEGAILCKTHMPWGEENPGCLEQLNNEGFGLKVNRLNGSHTGIAD